MKSSNFTEQAAYPPISVNLAHTFIKRVQGNKTYAKCPLITPGKYPAETSYKRSNARTRRPLVQTNCWSDHFYGIHTSEREVNGACLPHRLTDYFCVGHGWKGGSKPSEREKGKLTHGILL